MSMFQNITAYITADASGVEGGVNQANAALSQLETAVTRNWWGLQNLGLAFAAFPTAVAAGVGVAVNAASELEDAMIGIERTTGEGGEALDQIKDQILAVAKNTPIATKTLLGLAEAGGALGIPTEALGEFARIMGNLIASTDLTEAHVNDLARILNVMQVPVSEYENFASTLIDVGRNTAATETEIANLARRLSGTGQIAGMTAAEILGISAAVLSLGPRAEAGATAVQKTIVDMATAISEGKEEIQVFAAVAGMSVDEFAQKFRDAPADAFAAFITGLGQLEGGLGGVTEALGALGITEARQTQALAALAAGTRNVGSEQTDLNTILDAARSSYSENATLSEIAARRADSLSGQLQILRNIIFEAGAAFGQYFLPVLRPIISLLQNFFAGVAALPAPLRIGIIAVTTITAAVMALAAAFILIGPRLVIAAQAAGQLTVAFFRASGAARELAASEGHAAAQAYAQTRANQFLSVSLQRVGRMARWAAAGMALVTVATTIFGSKQKEIPGVNTDVAETGEAIPPVMNDISDALSSVGDEAKEYADEMEGIAQAHVDFVQATRRVDDALDSLRDAEEELNEARADAADRTEEVADAEGALSNARERHQDALDRLVEAEEELATARQEGLDDLADANDSLADANDRYQDALEKITESEEKLAEIRGEDWADKIADQEERLADARRKVRSATQEVEDSEWHLAYLRGEGASLRDIAEAEETVQAARENLASATRDQSKEEEELARLQDPLTRAREIAKAEREVAEARRDAQKALRDISEREQELARIREAVARDEYFTDAQRNYERAQRAVGEALRDIAQAEEDLNDARAGTEDMKRLRDAQERYEDALWNVAEAKAEVAKQAALMRGEIWTAKDAANALADELERVGFIGEARTLRRAPNVPEIEEGGGGGGGGLLGDNFASDLQKELEEASKDALEGFEIDPGAEQSWLEKWSLPILALAPFAAPFVRTAVGGIGKRIIGAFSGRGLSLGIGAAIRGLFGRGMGAAGAGIGTAVAPGVGTVIGAIVGTVGAYLVSETGLGDKIKGWVGEAFNGARVVANTVMGFFKADTDKAAQAISDTHGKLAAGMATSFQQAYTIFNETAMAGRTLNDQTWTAIVQRIDQGAQAAITAAAAQRDEVIASATYLRDQTGTLSAEQAQRIIDNANRQYTESVNHVRSQRDNTVTALTEMKNSGTPITEEMKNTITGHFNEMMNAAATAVETGKNRQLALYTALRAGVTGTNEETAVKVVQQAIKTKNETVRAAEDQYTAIVDHAGKLLDAGAINHKEYTAMILDAEDTRKKTVASANSQYAHILEEVRQKMPNITSLVNTENGKVKSSFDRLKDGVISTVGNMVNEATGLFGRMANALVLNSIVPDMVKAMLSWFGRLATEVPTMMDSLTKDSIRSMSDLDSIPETLRKFNLDYLAGPNGINIGLPRNIEADATQAATAVKGGDTFNLEAITNADADDIVNQFMFAKRVRTRG